MNDAKTVLYAADAPIPGTHSFVRACEERGYMLLDVTNPPQGGWTWEEVGRCERLSGDLRISRQYMALQPPGQFQTLENAQGPMRLCIDITMRSGEKFDWCQGYNARRTTTRIPFTRVVVNVAGVDLLIPPTGEKPDPMRLCFTDEHVARIVERLSVVDLSSVKLDEGICCVGRALPAFWIGHIVPFCPPL